MASSVGSIDRAYLSSTAFLDQRDILNQVLDLYEEEKTVMDIMDMTGRSKVTAQPDYHHFVNDYLYKPATLAAGAVSDPGAGNAVTLTITAAADLPIVGEVGIVHGSDIRFLVQATNSGTPSVTIIPVDSADTFGDFAGGETLAFFSSAYTEGSSSNTMRRSNVIKSDNVVEIFKTKTTVTDLGKGSKVETNFKGKPYYFIKQQHDAWTKHRMDVAFAMLLGKKSVGLVDAGGNAVNTTMGLDQYIENTGGISRAVDVAGVVDRDDLRKLSRVMDRNRAPREYMIWAGGEIDNKIEDAFHSAGNISGQGSEITYNAFGKGGKALALDLGVDSFKIYGRIFHKKRLPALDHAQVTNFAGTSKFPGYAYFIPASKIKVDSGSDGGGMFDRMCVRYMEYEDGVNTRYSEKLLGGLAPTPTDDRSVLDVVYESIEGLHVLGIEHFAKLDLNDSDNYL